MTTDKKDVVVNPYFYGGPVKSAPDFFGREEQLRTVFERLSKGGSTSLIGERRSGKSSLLYYLMTDAAQHIYSLDGRKPVFVYIDPALGLREPGDFYRELLEVLAEQVPELALKLNGGIGERQVVSALRKLAPRRLVLLLDEFQEISSVGNFSGEFFRFLRGLASRYETCFITATMEELSECCPPEVVSSPFANIFAGVYLSSWTEAEFTLFLSETSQRSGVPLQAYHDAIQEVAGRFPFYVQMASSFYFDVWRKHGGITVQDHVNVKQRFADEARPHFERMWKSHVSVAEKTSMISLAHGRTYSDNPALHTLEQKGYVLDGHLFSSALVDFILRKEASGEKLLPDVPAGPKGPVAQGIWVDKEAGDVWVDGKRIAPLTRLEYKLLLYLYDNADHICDKYGLVESVWSSDYIDEVDDPRIAKLVSRLRDDVEPDPRNSRYIVTVHGRGYKLVNESA